MAQIVRKFINTKEDIKKLLGLNEEEYMQLIHELADGLTVKYPDTICIKISVEDVEH